MKVQLCKFRLKGQEFQPGLAFVDSYGDYNVKLIVDETGKKVSKTKLHDYALVDGPLSYIATHIIL